MKQKNFLFGILIFVLMVAVNVMATNVTNDTLPPVINAYIYPDTGNYSDIYANVTDNIGVDSIYLYTNDVYTDMRYCNGSLFCFWMPTVYRATYGYYTYTIRTWDTNDNYASLNLYANYTTPTTTTTTTTPTSTTIPQNTCFDSDGGLNIYVKGNVSGVVNGSGYSYSYSDSCSTPNIVYEWTCGSFDTPDLWALSCGTNYTCNDGACVVQTTTTTTSTTTTTTSTTTTTLPGCLLTSCNRRNASTDVTLIQPSTNWKKVSGSLISRSDTKRYKINITTPGRYEFSFCPIDGGNANYDSWLCLLNSAGMVIKQNDDYCSLKSKIIYNITSVGTQYIQVSGYGYGYGSYTLAYRRNA